MSKQKNIINAPKVENMRSAGGTAIANQFIILTNNGPVFQSYSSVIAFKCVHDRTVYLDAEKWDYSQTTGKYRNQFLGETKKETEAKIKSGEYVLVDLNS